VVTKIPVAWETISRNSSFATLMGAEEGLISMAVHCVCLTLMSEKACCGRELEILAGWELAFVWLKMRVHEFTDARKLVSKIWWDKGERRFILIVALELLRSVLAICLCLPWAMVESVSVGSDIVV